MSKQHFAGFLAALAVSAVQFYALETGSATAPKDRGNPAVVDVGANDSRLAGPAATAAVRRHSAARGAGQMQDDTEVGGGPLGEVLSAL